MKDLPVRKRAKNSQATSSVFTPGYMLKTCIPSRKPTDLPPADYKKNARMLD